MVSTRSKQQESYLVIGGEGFLGSTMVRMLLERYPTASVSSLDLVQRHFPSEKAPKWTFYSADLTSLESLRSAFSASGATTVFHTASPWTGSGKEVCEKVNVVGTRTVVEACKAEGVKKLVYTSSAGTVFNGGNLMNVDERLPFPETGLDHYNTTKAQAETIVLEANGQGDLLTVAIRPAGIFGPGDRQATPGFLDVLKGGKTMFQIGDNQNLFDWTYVDNVVHAHLLAAERLDVKVPFKELSTRFPPVDKDIPRRLLPTSTYRPPSLLDSEKSFDPTFTNTSTTDEPLGASRTRYDQFYAGDGKPGSSRSPPAELPIAGEAFFITNGEPITFWDFPRALWFEYNGHVPRFVVPIGLGMGHAVGGISEAISAITGRPANLTRARVAYSGVHRYYNIEKARRVLGYEPIVGLQEGIKRAIASYKENEANSAKSTKA